VKPGPETALTPSPSSRTGFQSFLKPVCNVEPEHRGFSFNSVSHPLKPTNNKKEKEITAKFHSFTPTTAPAGGRQERVSPWPNGGRWRRNELDTGAACPCSHWAQRYDRRDEAHDSSEEAPQWIAALRLRLVEAALRSVPARYQSPQGLLGTSERGDTEAGAVKGWSSISPAPPSSSMRRRSRRTAGASSCARF
jgi:hypothetical protein